MPRTVKEYAIARGVTRRTVINWIKDGYLIAQREDTWRTSRTQRWQVERQADTQEVRDHKLRRQALKEAIEILERAEARQKGQEQAQAEPRYVDDPDMNQAPPASTDQPSSMPPTQIRKQSTRDAILKDLEELRA